MSSPLIDQFRKGGVSKDVRLTAATGMLPLKPMDQVELLLLLTRDKDEEIRGKAETGLLAITPEDLAGVLKERYEPTPKFFISTALGSNLQIYCKRSFRIRRRMTRPSRRWFRDFRRTCSSSLSSIR